MAAKIWPLSILAELLTDSINLVVLKSPRQKIKQVSTFTSTLEDAPGTRVVIMRPGTRHSPPGYTRNISAGRTEVQRPPDLGLCLQAFDASVPLLSVERHCPKIAPESASDPELPNLNRCLVIFA